MYERLKYLHEKFIEGSASDEELSELQSLLDEHGETEAVQQLMKERWKSAMQSRDLLPAESLKRISDNILEVGKVHSSRKRFVWSIAAAACLIGFTFTFLYKYNQSSIGQEQKQPTASMFEVSDTTLVPARNAAKLVLGDGSVTVIDGLKDNWQKDQGIAGITHNAEILKYTDKDIKNSGSPVYNILSTGFGETFPSLQLGDGTRIWLNAGSTIKFPVSFNGMSHRVVEVSGEVYFDVAKDASRPFLVRFGNDTVSVLGTQFNIAAYPDETVQSVTLVEGSVVIHQIGKHYQLSPGKEARIYNNGMPLKIAQSNIAQVTAWKDNLFYFDQTEIASAMREISRWYDLQIDFKGNLKRTLTGQIPRSVPADTLFKALELSGNIKYKIQGRHVEITM